MHPISDESDQICSNHGNCDERALQIKLTKGFKAKEMVKRRMASLLIKLFSRKPMNCLLLIEIHQLKTTVIIDR